MRRPALYVVGTHRGERLTLTAAELVERQAAGEHFTFVISLAGAA